MLAMLPDRTKKEVTLVSSVSGGKLTVVRDYGGHVSGSGGTTGDAHATTCTFEIIGYLNFQGSSVTKTDNFAKRNRTTKHNYSILDDWLQITVGIWSVSIAAPVPTTGAISSLASAAP